MASALALSRSAGSGAETGVTVGVGVGTGCAVGTCVGVGTAVGVGTGVDVGGGVEVGIGGGAVGVGAGDGVDVGREASAAAVGGGACGGSGSESPQAVMPTVSTRMTARIIPNLNRLPVQAPSGQFARQRKLGRQRRNDITTPIMVDSLWAG